MDDTEPTPTSRIAQPLEPSLSDLRLQDESSIGLEQSFMSFRKLGFVVFRASEERADELEHQLEQHDIRSAIWLDDEKYVREEFDRVVLSPHEAMNKFLVNVGFGDKFVSALIPLSSTTERGILNVVEQLLTTIRNGSGNPVRGPRSVTDGAWRLEWSRAAPLVAEDRIEHAMQNFRDLNFLTSRASASWDERVRFAKQVERQPTDVLRSAVYLDNMRGAQRLLKERGACDPSQAMHRFLVSFGAGEQYCEVLMDVETAISKERIVQAVRKMKANTDAASTSAAIKKADDNMQRLLAEEDAAAAAKASRKASRKAKKANGKAKAAASVSDAVCTSSGTLAAAQDAERASSSSAPPGTQSVPQAPSAPPGTQSVPQAPSAPPGTQSVPPDDACVESEPSVEVQPPDEYLCPISHELMEDPVLASDGHAYERRQIERWFARSLTSPKTGEALEISTVFPNHPLRRLILEWRESHGCKKDK